MRLPDPLDAVTVAERARERGVLIEPGGVFFMADPPPAPWFRLGYTAIPSAAIAPGIRALAEVVRDLTR